LESQIIAPSPIPSLKLKKDSVESKRVYSVESSGYETSPVISSDNNMDIHPSLEDDDSLNLLKQKHDFKLYLDNPTR
jgi:hypothetical protein